MSSLSIEKTADHLMHLIVTRNGDVPNFSLFLGAGASSTSRVQTAEDMVDEWRNLLFHRNQGECKYETWLADQDWFEHEDEYSLLFEMIYDQPSQRRVYVEECLKDSHPNWGYVYLTNLLANRFFDVVFTTNFDDLINEACFLYSEGLRPLVAAHDSAIQGIRITSRHPKILKLHGDFLYDNIKNTLSELETLETNTKRKLSQFAKEYGLVVLGYSGRDQSVMDTLELLLRDQDNFRQGVYWCIRRGTAKSGRLESLLRRDRVYLVEIDGFDEFTADLHKTAQLTLPKPIARPFDIARDRARLFVEVKDPLKSHPVIDAHIGEVLGSLNSLTPQIPLPVKAILLSSSGESDEAFSIWKQAYEEDPSDSYVAYQYADALADAGRDEELVEFIHKSPLDMYDITYFLLRAGKDQEVVDLATQVLADTVTRGSRNDRAIVRINRAIALKRLDRSSEMLDDLDFLERSGDTEKTRIKAGVAALRGNKEDLLVALGDALHKTFQPDELRKFPVFEDFRNDPDFIKLMQSESQV